MSDFRTYFRVVCHPTRILNRGFLGADFRAVHSTLRVRCSRASGQVYARSRGLAVDRVHSLPTVGRPSRCCSTPQAY